MAGCGGGTIRPADSNIPASARWLMATVTWQPTLVQARPKTRTLRTVVATNPSVVHAVARAVNALPIAHPEGHYPSCPAHRPPFVHLTFRNTASSATLARVLIETDACTRSGGATAWITISRVHQFELTDTRAPKGKSLTNLIEAALGHRLHLT
jgi:hypothetical protein